jgi:hypothetical protein
MQLSNHHCNVRITTNGKGTTLVVPVTRSAGFATLGAEDELMEFSNHHCNVRMTTNGKGTTLVVPITFKTRRGFSR